MAIEDPALRARYVAAVDYACLHFGNAFATTAMLAAYSAGGPWLGRLKRHIEGNIRFLEEFVAARVPGIAVAARPEASYLVWLDCRGLGLEGESGAEVSALSAFMLGCARVKLSDGLSFGGPPTARFQRINVACPRALLAAALGRIADAVADSQW